MNMKTRDSSMGSAEPNSTSQYLGTAASTEIAFSHGDVLHIYKLVRRTFAVTASQDAVYHYAEHHRSLSRFCLRDPYT